REVVVRDVVRLEQRGKGGLADLGLEAVDRLLEIGVRDADAVLRRVVLCQPELDHRRQRIPVARGRSGVVRAVRLSARRVLQAEEALEDPCGHGQLRICYVGPGDVGGRGRSGGASAGGREDEQRRPQDERNETAGG